MKRIWTRIAIVTGILAMGGFGAYLGQPPAEPDDTELAEGFGTPGPESPNPLPLPTEEDPYATPPAEPAAFTSAYDREAPAEYNDGTPYGDDSQVRPAAQYDPDGAVDTYAPAYSDDSTTPAADPSETPAADPSETAPANIYGDAYSAGTADNYSASGDQMAADQTDSTTTGVGAAIGDTSPDAGDAATEPAPVESAAEPPYVAPPALVESDPANAAQAPAADADSGNLMDLPVNPYRRSETTPLATSSGDDVNASNQYDATAADAGAAPLPVPVATDESNVPDVRSDEIAGATAEPAELSTGAGAISDTPAPAATAANPPAADALAQPVGDQVQAPYEPPVSQYSSRPLRDALREDEVSENYATATPNTPSGAAPTQLTASTPGARELEGPQSPVVSIEKRAPREVQVGSPTTFEILVRNTGKAAAHDVIVTDQVPRGTEFRDAVPQPMTTPDGALAWNLGTIEPGENSTIKLELVPVIEGEIGSVAQVSFNAQASVRTVSTQPQLVLKHSGPQQVLIGEDVVFDITLSNEGTGPATGLILEEDVPLGLAHSQGRKLEYEVGTLRPKETKRLQLVLKADEAAAVANVLKARADGGIEVADTVNLNVIAPILQVSIRGPSKRYLERRVTYEVGLANPGSASAHDIELSVKLPKGMRFVSADNKGTYDKRTHAVYWGLEELPAQESGAVQLVAIPIAAGEQRLAAEATGSLGLAKRAEHITMVEAITELVFSVSDVQDPIEIGAETTYEVRVVNNGSKVATNVQLAAAFPIEVTPLDGKGPTRVDIEGQQVIMEALPRIGPREEVVYRVVARGNAAGDHVIDVRLVSDEVPRPVIKQEGTKVYADE